MNNKKKSAVERLYELESEMCSKATGMRLPSDPELTDVMARLLTHQNQNADLQITVTSERKTTTTKQYYETETPGMLGLPLEQLIELQRKLMEKIS